MLMLIIYTFIFCVLTFSLEDIFNFASAISKFKIFNSQN